MIQTPETQRAIIAGPYKDKSNQILEIRAKLVVPKKITTLETPEMRFTIDGIFDENGYCAFGRLYTFPVENQYTFPLEIQTEPEYNPKLISLLDLRWIILQDGRVYRRSTPSDQTDLEKLTEKRFRRESLAIDRPFDFQTMWVSVGEHLKGLGS